MGARVAPFLFWDTAFCAPADTLLVGSALIHVENYFNYFTEIEEHFQRRRGTLLLLSPLDWALMETWKDAGVPLQAVLRGIDVTFEKWERRPRRTRRVNGLAYCAQEVLASAEELKEAAVGQPMTETRNTGLEQAAVAGYLRRNAEQLDKLQLPGSVELIAHDTAAALRELAASLGPESTMHMEDLERRLTVAEEKLLAALMAATPDAALYGARSEADRDLAPYRRKMSAPQIEQLHKQYIYKRLLEQYRVPRLSLFYM
ncbi:MAG TPA: hypothetical protein VL240_02085 [Candidatus Binatia bacterium]|nr:hypothetical protein [Candidatus Binatia bacterium]